VELIVEEVDWDPRPAKDEIVGVRVAIEEVALRQQVRNAGGKWNWEKKVWNLPYEQVVAMGLKKRMVREAEGFYEVAIAGEDVVGEEDGSQEDEVSAEPMA
jgi:hypothetical protein